MKKLPRSSAANCAIYGLLFLTSAVSQGADSACDSIAQDVTAAIAKNSANMLMIVEDALVINESCACEIVKAAIVAAKADSAMVNQIVQTSIAVAPKMSGVIMDCASAISPSGTVTKPVVENPLDNSGKGVVTESYDAKAPVENPEPWLTRVQVPTPIFINTPPGVFRRPMSPSKAGVSQ